MLSGRYPREKLVPSYVDHPDNLFSFLAPDYRIRAFETITQLCDPARCDNTDPAGGDHGLRGLLGQTWQVAKTLAKPYDDDCARLGPVRRGVGRHGDHDRRGAPRP